MRQSQLFTKTRREAPSDEVSKNAALLIRAGFINKEMAGVYDYLPLGLRVLHKIENIIRDEMNALGGQEVLMSTLQRKELWEKTNRWNDEIIDVWFKTNLKNGGELGLGPTHEEPITNMVEQFVPSYRNLPFSVYQFQNKFRNEIRASSGVIRTREFVMKDLYSFHESDKSLDQFYEKVSDAYVNIFEKCGIGKNTYKTFASGGVFSKYSHEFQTVSDAGEDTVYINEESKVAINKEVYNDEVLFDLKIDKSKLVEKKSIEVGNIFKLGVKFSEPLSCKFKNESGEDMPVVMGCYGIGPARVLGTIVETLSDEKGIVWPKEVAPFDVHLLRLGETEEVKVKAEEIYKKLSEKVEVLYDDRDLRAGEKFADADLLGVPIQVIVGEKGLKENTLEIKDRKTGEVKNIHMDELHSIV
ncbi:MAG TPA: aminoacyl--tRNA ligase-related protein [Candidatus Paceibacterota bacterium]